MVAINYLAVLVAAVAAMIIGGAWYSPMMFAKAWMKSLGKSQGVPDGKAGKAMSGMFVTVLVEAYVLAHFVVYAGATTAMGGAQLGFWIWLGFIATYTATIVLFEGRAKSWWYITNGYQLINLVVMSMILAVWK